MSDIDIAKCFAVVSAALLSGYYYARWEISWLYRRGRKFTFSGGNYHCGGITYEEGEGVCNPPDAFYISKLEGELFDQVKANALQNKGTTEAFAESLAEMVVLCQGTCHLGDDRKRAEFYKGRWFA